MWVTIEMVKKGSMEDAHAREIVEQLIYIYN